METCTRRVRAGGSRGVVPTAERPVQVTRKSDGRTYALKKVSIRSMSEREVQDAMNEIRCVQQWRDRAGNGCPTPLEQIPGLGAAPERDWVPRGILRQSAPPWPHVRCNLPLHWAVPAAPHHNPHRDGAGGRGRLGERDRDAPAPQALHSRRPVRGDHVALGGPLCGLRIPALTAARLLPAHACRVWHYFVQLLEGLGQLHRIGILHRGRCITGCAGAIRVQPTTAQTSSPPTAS